MILNGIVIPAIAAFLTVTTVVKMETEVDTPDPVQVQVLPLKLVKPRISWMAPGSGGQPVMCLDSQSFIVHQMYIQGLEHIKTTCMGEENPLYANK